MLLNYNHNHNFIKISCIINKHTTKIWKCNFYANCLDLTDSIRKNYFNIEGLVVVDK